MNIYKLELTDWEPYSDITFAVTVVASDEDEARLLASDRLGNDIWLDTDWVKASKIPMVPGVIATDEASA